MFQANERSASEQARERLQKLLDNNVNLLSVLNHVAEGICITDIDGKIVFTNAEFNHLIAHPEQHLEDQLLTDVVNIHGCKATEFWTKIQTELSSSAQVHHREYLLGDAKTNNLQPVSLAYYLLPDEFNDKKYVVLLVQDLFKQQQSLLNHAKALKAEHPSLGLMEITQEVTKQDRKISYFETHDSLTGLFNRKYFKQQLDHIIESSKTIKSEHTLMYIDLDQFKIVNDSCGLSAGDTLLTEIAALIKSKVRKWDIVARMGDDEFGLMLLYCEQKHAQRIADDMRQVIRDYEFLHNGVVYHVSASIALVTVDPTSENTNDMLSKVDTTCTLAKDDGGDRVYVYQADNEAMATRYGELCCVSTINKALTDDQFTLFAQSIVPLQDTVEGLSLEILVRLQNEKGEIIPPNLFLPAAERFHMIQAVDRWVIKQACMQLAEAPTFLHKLNKLSINLSGHTLSDIELADHICKTVAEYNIPAEKLCFEITETGAIANIEQALKLMSTLKEQGFAFALDDFGSGLSSFGYLKTLPVDYLKIDGMFVRDLINNPTDLAMVRSINEIGHVMGKKTIAEFVEDEQTRKQLKMLGVDYAQGYGIAKPIPFSEHLNR